MCWGWPAGLCSLGPVGSCGPGHFPGPSLPDGAFIRRFCSPPPGSCWPFCASHSTEAETCSGELVLASRQLSAFQHPNTGTRLCCISEVLCIMGKRRQQALTDALLWSLWCQGCGWSQLFKQRAGSPLRAMRGPLGYHHISRLPFRSSGSLPRRRCRVTGNIPEQGPATCSALTHPHLHAATQPALLGSTSWPFPVLWRTTALCGVKRWCCGFEHCVLCAFHQVPQVTCLILHTCSPFPQRRKMDAHR